MTGTGARSCHQPNVFKGPITDGQLFSGMTCQTACPLTCCNQVSTLALPGVAPSNHYRPTSFQTYLKPISANLARI